MTFSPSDLDPCELAQHTLSALTEFWSHQSEELDHSDLKTLKALKKKLQQNSITIAAFGLVNRGKSAVLNALYGSSVLTVGPLNGVTRQTTAIMWSPEIEESYTFTLIDTPGLNEVEGEAREQLAWSAAHVADLILFIISGDITQIEYDALLELRTLLKPIILVFNKVDLYPDRDRQAIYNQLTSPTLRQLVSPDEIVMVAASPNPVNVRIHWPDGQITYEWEKPDPVIAPLQSTILQVLNREGRGLLALNVLTQLSQLQERWVQTRVAQAESTITARSWWFLMGKSGLVGLCPSPLLDLLLATGADLAMITTLVQTLQIPLSPGTFGLVIQRLTLSLGILTLIELGSNALLNGFDVSLSTLTGIPSLATPWYWGTALVQAILVSLGSHSLTHQIQTSVVTEFITGPLSPKLQIQTILEQLPPESILNRLHSEVRQRLGLTDPTPNSLTRP